MNDEQEPGLAGHVPAGVRPLAYAGLIPFVLLTGWLIAIDGEHVWRAQTILLLKTYAAIILSFLGGIRWGLAIAAPENLDKTALRLSVVPALAGWFFLFLPEPYSFAAFAAAFAAHGAWDRFAALGGKAPDWFGGLRSVLTLIVVAIMIAAFTATA